MAEVGRFLPSQSISEDVERPVNDTTTQKSNPNATMSQPKCLTKACGAQIIDTQKKSALS